jgi:hypothetical protein
LYVDSSPTKITYLKFDTSALAGQTLAAATLRITTTSGSSSGSPDTQVVHPVSDSSWTESGLTYNTRPAVGPANLGSVSNTASNTTYSISLNASQLQSLIGGQLTLALDATGGTGDAFYINSREAAANRPQLVLTTGTPTTTTTGTTTTATTVAPTSTTAATTTTTTPGGGVTVTANADSFVQSDVPTAGHGSDPALYVDSSPTKITYLKFDTSALAGQTLAAATLRITTTSGSTSGSPDTQVVHPVSDSSWTESGLTYNTRPAVGPANLGSVSNTTSNTTYSITLNASQLQSLIGGQLTVALDSTGGTGDAFYINSREAAANRPQLVLTAQ